MTKSLRFLLVLLACFALLSGVKKAGATHIVGGDMTYEYVGNNNYTITLKLYIDCFFGQPGAISSDVNSRIGVFNSSGTLLKSLKIFRQGPTRVSGSNYSCVIPPTDQCVDLYVYTASANLPNIPGGYRLEFQRCCRNNGIKNIRNPDVTGSTYRTFIPQRANGRTNSSARFIGAPPNFLCTDELLDYDHSAVDPDGDSLVYELYQPLHGGSQVDPAPTPANFSIPLGVQWQTGYSTIKQVRSIPDMAIDPVTGKFTMKPQDTGKFVVGIAVHEYRNGTRINTVYRDFQFNIYYCNFDVKSVFAPNNGYCSPTVSFTNASTGNVDHFRWDFGVEGTEADSSRVNNPTFTFPGTGKYVVRLDAVSDAGCKNSSFRIVHILADTIEALIQDSIVCYGEQVQLGNPAPEDGISYKWSPATNLDNPNVPNPKATVFADATYSVRKSSVSCYVESKVNVLKNTIAADFVHEYLPPCDGLRVKFFNTSTNITKLYWDFGDVNSVRDISIRDTTQWFYSDSGVVYVNLFVENEHCRDSITKPIRIFFPEVFTGVIDTPICLGNRITIGPLNDTSILSFKWSSSMYMSDDEELYPEVAPEESYSYTLTKIYANCTQKDSFNVIINELPDLDIIRSYDGRVCPGDSILLTAQGNYSFEWIPKVGVREPFEAVTWVQPDTHRWYYLKATTAAKCVDYDSVFLEIYPFWTLDLDPSYVLCKDEVFLPKVPIDSATITWRVLGSDVLLDSIRTEGYFVVNATTQCQNLLDTFELAYYHDSYCVVELPNSFTPNSDGLNDTYPYDGNFRNIFGMECSFDSYQLIIFNRWGEVMFRSTDPTEEWTGEFKNNGGHQEVYGYYLTYREFDYCRGGYVVRVKRGNLTALH